MRALPAVAWALALLVAAGGMAFAGPTSELVVPILWRFGVEKNRAYELHNVIRKCLHVPAYAVLAVLVAWAVGPRRRRGLYTLLLVLGVACIDEWIQSLSPGRHASGLDVLLDMVGAVLGLGLTGLWRSGARRSA